VAAGGGTAEVRAAAPPPRGPVATVATRPVTVACLLSLHLVLFLWTFRATDLGADQLDDASRFHAIATAPGVPYRDRPVEYAPGETLLIELLGHGSVVATARAVAVVSFGADLATFALLRRRAGARAASRYLALGAPLLPFIYLRLDPVPTALAVLAVALADRARERVGGVALAVAALAKAWAVVLAPWWLVTRRRTALTWFAAAAAIGLAVWLFVGGLGAPGQVATFRHATGWHVAGSVGDLVWLVGGGTPSVQAGALRIGVVPGWAPIALALAAIATETAIWRRATPVEGIGPPALAAVAALVLASPLFSIQYVWWFLPWAAISPVERSRLPLVGTFLVAVLTLLLAWALVWGGPHVTGFRGTVGAWAALARNLGCATIVGWYLLRRRGAPT